MLAVGGIVIGIVGIVIGVVATRYYSNRPGRLEYEVLAEEHLYGFKPITVQGLGFQKSPTLIVLRVKNVGHTEIAASDFEGDVTFAFGGMEVVAAEATGPTNAKIVKGAVGGIGFTPTLMKPGDFVTFTIWADYDHLGGGTNSIGVGGRIKGVPEIRAKGWRQRPSLWSALLDALPKPF